MPVRRYGNQHFKFTHAFFRLLIAKRRRPAEGPRRTLRDVVTERVVLEDRRRLLQQDQRAGGALGTFEAHWFARLMRLRN